MHINDKLFEILPLLKKLPTSTYVDNNAEGTELTIQANTQEQARELRCAFPAGLVWIKAYDADCKWWSYHTIWNGVRICIYAIKDAPKTCTAIIEKRKVTKKVPVEFKEIEVEENVIVGWNCDGH